MIRITALLALALAWGCSPAVAQDITNTFPVGQRIVYRATTDGNPVPTIEWFRNSVKIATGDTLTIVAATTADSGTITCRAFNTAGSMMSANRVLLTIDDRIAPTIQQQPVGMSPAEGTHVALVVVASGSPAPTYQWRKNGVVIAGATASTLKFEPVTRTDSGTYDVVVTNSKATINSAPAVVNVLYAPSPPTIKQAFSAMTLYKGDVVTLSVVVDGDPPLTYLWQHGSVVLTGERTPSITFYVQNAKDAGQYKVSVTGPSATATHSAIMAFSTGKRPTNSALR